LLLEAEHIVQFCFNISGGLVRGTEHGLCHGPLIAMCYPASQLPEKYGDLDFCLLPSAFSDCGTAPAELMTQVE
jgi:hypothetical protein